MDPLRQIELTAPRYPRRDWPKEVVTGNPPWGGDPHELLASLQALVDAPAKRRGAEGRDDAKVALGAKVRHLEKDQAALKERMARLEEALAKPAAVPPSVPAEEVARAMSRLDALAAFEAGWDGEEAAAPAGQAIAWARVAVGALAAAGFTTARINPKIEGGIALEVDREEERDFLSIYNDATVVLVRRWRRDGACLSMEFPAAELPERIATALSR